MFDDIINLLGLPGFAELITAVLSAIGALLVALYTFKRPARRDIRIKTLESVIAPIHMLLREYKRDNKNISQLKVKMTEIVKRSYEYAPDYILVFLFDMEEKYLEENIEQLKERINWDFCYLRYSLGYPNIGTRNILAIAGRGMTFAFFAFFMSLSLIITIITSLVTGNFVVLRISCYSSYLFLALTVIVSRSPFKKKPINESLSDSDNESDDKTNKTENKNKG